ncbi:hypothetical protein KSP40_PGU005912 [Platanthera guangdongensis]|uniref:Uncharacterized protein n=1 Tax=Platanthera guangdongensis TaxID=2320717 RepID=A0ABR2MVJ2_9ASPA
MAAGALKMKSSSSRAAAASGDQAAAASDSIREHSGGGSKCGSRAAVAAGALKLKSSSSRAAAASGDQAAAASDSIRRSDTWSGFISAADDVRRFQGSGGGDSRRLIQLGSASGVQTRRRQNQEEDRALSPGDSAIAGDSSEDIISALQIRQFLAVKVP